MEKIKKYYIHVITGILAFILSFNILILPITAQTIVPVSQISDVLSSMKATETTDLPTTLTATVIPSDATYQNITWSIKDGGETGAILEGVNLTVPVGGTIVLTATIVNGIVVGQDYTKDFTVNVELNNKQRVAYVNNEVKTALEGFSVTNKTTKQEMSDYIHGIILDTGYTNVSLDWQLSTDFTKVLSTVSQEGSITGQINFICNKEVTSLSINKVIPKLVPKATSSSQTVNGFINEQLLNQSIAISLEDEAINQDISLNSNLISSIVKGLPKGLTVNLTKALVAGDTKIELTLSGIPTEIRNDIIELNVPGSILESGQDLSVQTNESLKWDIQKNIIKDLQDVKEIVEQDIKSVEVLNSTSKESLLIHINNTILNYYNSQIKASWKTFYKEESTVSKKGQISGELILTSEGKSMTMAIQKDIALIKSYPIKEGDHSIWTPKSNDKIEIRVDGEFSKFTGIKINGKDIDKSLYSVRSGSTIVTFEPHFLKTLNSGQFELMVQFTDGQAVTQFTIQNEDQDVKGPEEDKDISDTTPSDKTEVKDTSNPTTKEVSNETKSLPKTSDINMSGYYYGMLALSVLGFIYIKKRNNAL